MKREVCVRVNILRGKLEGGVRAPHPILSPPAPGVAPETLAKDPASGALFSKSLLQN